MKYIILFLLAFLVGCKSCNDLSTTEVTNNDTITVVDNPIHVVDTKTVHGDGFTIEIPSYWNVELTNEKQLLLYSHNINKEEKVLISKESKTDSNDTYLIKLQRSFGQVGAKIDNLDPIDGDGSSLVNVSNLPYNVYMVLTFKGEYVYGFLCKYGDDLLENNKNCGKIYKSLELK